MTAEEKDDRDFLLMVLERVYRRAVPHPDDSDDDRRRDLRIIASLAKNALVTAGLEVADGFATEGC